MKKKILYATHFILGYGANSWRVSNIARALRKEGYVIDLIQYIKKNPPNRFEIESSKFSVIPNKVVQSSRPLASLIHLNYVIKNDYDLVIANNINGALFSLLGRFNIPLLLDMHGDLIEEYKLKNSIESGSTAFHLLPRLFVCKVVESLAFKFSNKISCVSHKMMNYFNEKGIPIEKMFYAPNCVDLEFFSPLSPNDQRVTSLRRELGITKDKMVFGYIGRFQKWQGVESFINAARKIRGENVMFLIVGGNETKREDNIFLISEITVSRIPLYYSVCDVLVLPRPSHPVTEVAGPTKFAEYAAMGKPILTTDVGDPAVLVRRYKCGVVVEDNGVGKLVDGIMCLLKSRDEKLTAMGKSARLLAEREFDFDITIRNFSKCIDALT